jgi:hypothetical protein
MTQELVALTPSTPSPNEPAGLSPPEQPLVLEVAPRRRQRRSTLADFFPILGPKSHSSQKGSPFDTSASEKEELSTTSSFRTRTTSSSSTLGHKKSGMMVDTLRNRSTSSSSSLSDSNFHVPTGRLLCRVPSSAMSGCDEEGLHFKLKLGEILSGHSVVRQNLMAVMNNDDIRQMHEQDARNMTSNAIRLKYQKLMLPFNPAQLVLLGEVSRNTQRQRGTFSYSKWLH